MDTAHPALDEIVGDEYGAAEYDEREGHIRRWVRYVMPVMVEVDCEDDEITSVVMLPSEIRLDRDDAMELCIYDEAFRRQPRRGAAADARLVYRRAGMAASPHPRRLPGQLAAHHGLARRLLPRDADADAYSEVNSYGDEDQE